jgi:peptidoglycan/LPS O-acetylase OafA/YrhL
VISRFLKSFLSKLSRDTTSGQFIAEIDGLRFVAIVSVVLYHVSIYVTAKSGRDASGDILATVLEQGKLGVQLFFIISGFIIALPFARAHFEGKERPGLKAFFLRRLTRLEPPYLISLAIGYVLILLVRASSSLELLPHLAASAFYVHNVAYNTVSAINAVAWSLEIEFQFYVIAPLLTTIFAVRSDSVRRLLLVTIIFITAYFIPRHFSNYTIIPYARYFLTGFLLLDLYLKELPKNPEKTIAWDLVSVSSWATFLWFVFLGPFWLVAAPLLVGYYSAFKGKYTNRVFCHPIVYTIGGMCYTIYLYHYTLICGLGKYMQSFAFFKEYPLWLSILAVCVIQLPIIMAVSIVLFIYIEKPCMRRRWYVDAYSRVSNVLSLKPIQ